MRTLPAAGLVLAVLLLAGCLPPQSPEANPTPVPTPAFASEAEALAAAEDAYAAYEEAVDGALSTYDKSKLREVAVGDALDAALKSVDSFESTGRNQVGLSTIDSTRLVSVDPLQIYACLDISQTDVVDAEGNSTLSATRGLRFPVVVSFDKQRLVESESVWDGDDFC